jgi:hypothetical protein
MTFALGLKREESKGEERLLKRVESDAEMPLAVKLLAVAAAAFAVHYYMLHEVLGLLPVDEIYFAHVFWLMRHGQSLYTDFYANHLPTYFYLLEPLLPGGGETDLGFVWVLRATGVIAVVAYLAMLWGLLRRDFIYLLPFLFMFITLGRMSEIRPDTVGLLLFNTGWFLLLRDAAPRNILIAAALAGVALTFSARAAVMALGMGLLMAWLCYQRRDWQTLRQLCLIGAAFFAFLATLYLLNPAGSQLMLRLVYFEPLAVTPDVPLWQRILPVDRLLMVVLICTALGASVWRRTDPSALVIRFACATQIILVLVDPSPYQYVYSWAAIPTFAGLSLLGFMGPRRLHAVLAGASSAIAALVIALSLSSPTPRPGSALRITYDRPFAAGELNSLPMAELMRLATTSERQEGAWNQLALFSEICRRTDGPVVTKFYANLICLPDARYDWAGLKWPPIFEGDSSTVSRTEFEELFAKHPPALVAWGKQHYLPTLNPWGQALLANYDIYDGYALRKQR